MRQTVRILSAFLSSMGLLAISVPPIAAQPRHVGVPQHSQPAAASRSAGGGQPWYALPQLPRLPWNNQASGNSHRPTGPGRNSTSATGKTASQAALARLAERRGQTQQAEAVYREMLKKDSTMVQSNHRLGVIEAKRGNFDAANTHFQIALMHTPKNVELLSDAGYCLYLQGRMEEAEELYMTALQIDPDSQSLCNNLGLLLGDQRRLDEALMIFKRCNSTAEAHANLGFVLSQLGEFELAERNFHAALNHDSRLRSPAIALLQLEAVKHNQAALAKATASQAEATADPDPSAPASSTSLPTIANAEHLPSRQTDISASTRNPEFQHLVDHVPASTAPARVRIVVGDRQAETEFVAPVSYWDGPSIHRPAALAEIVVGGQRITGDADSPFPVRYAARREVQDPVAPSSQPSAPNPADKLQKDDVPMQLPPAHSLAPRTSSVPQALVPQPSMPVTGTHYNLSPHSQPWASPTKTQSAFEIGDRSPATFSGATLPQQQLPTGPNAQSTFRR